MPGMRSDIKENFTKINCNYDSIFEYKDLLDLSLNKNYISEIELEKLKNWRDNPENWK